MARTRRYAEVDRFMKEAEKALERAERVAYRDSPESEHCSRIAAVWAELAKIEHNKPNT